MDPVKGYPTGFYNAVEISIKISFLPKDCDACCYLRNWCSELSVNESFVKHLYYSYWEYYFKAPHLSNSPS